MKNDNTPVDIDFAEAAVPHYARRGIVTMFMIMLGFTFFSASMWVGKELADGLDFSGFIISMIIGGLILSLYTGLLGYVGAETGMSLDLLARKAFGAKGSYLPSAMISFTQIGWFGVGIAMFAIPVANELLGGSTAAEWVLVIIAGVCMTASAYFGIKSLTLISYIAVPLVAILGTVAMVMAVKQGNGTLIDQFCQVQRYADRCRRRRSGYRLVCLRRHGNAEFLPLCPQRQGWCDHDRYRVLYRQLADVFLRRYFVGLRRRQ